MPGSRRDPRGSIGKRKPRKYNDFIARLLYNRFMVKDALIKTNPYLKNAVQREADLFTTVWSSTAIEGVRLSGLGMRKPSKKRVRPTAVDESAESYGSRR
jgi:hypothetical protein